MSRLKQRKIEEEWKTIPDYPNYEVSSLGRVRRIAKTGKSGPAKIGKVLKGTKQKGYLSVRLYKGDNCKNYWHVPVHRLVLITFIGPAPEDHVCNHKDFIRANNKLINLEWILEVKNNSICSSNGISKKPNLSESDVMKVREMKGKVRVDILAKQYNLHPTTIRKIQNKRIWKHI
jgi:hypothetical protein